MPACSICSEEHPENEMIGEVCVSCASIMHDNLDFEC
jgi:hypothetical protein